MCTTPVSGGMGMHLLQKMGWRPGEGLGKERNGALQPLLLEVKLDKKGLVSQEENTQNRRQKNRSNLMQQQYQQHQQHQQQTYPQQHRHQQQLQQQEQQQQKQQMPPPAPPGGSFNPTAGADAVAGTMAPCTTPLSEHKHPVSLLGELAAKRRWSLPTYSSVEEFGQPHQKQFLLLVNVNGMNYTPALMSNTKKEAKAVAARYALQQMGVL